MAKTTVNSGDKVTIIFLDRSGMHDLCFDAFHVKAAPLRPGQPAVATFIADKAGTYEFYSSKPQDREKGMTGTLVVQ